MKFEFKQNLENFLDLWQLLGCEPPGIVVSVSERDLPQGQLLIRFVSLFCSASFCNQIRNEVHTSADGK